MVAAASVGDLVLFAGGELAEDESGQGPSRESKRVDVWNARLKKWVASDDSLSVARKKTAAAVAAGKVIFAGGYAESSHQSVATWDMYDLATNKWSSGSLSSKRMRLQAVSLVANDGTEFALFIGGLGEFQQEGGIESCPHTWEATKSGPQCVYTTGGLCTTVDIYNGRTGEWSFTNLTRGRYEFAVRNGHFWSVLTLKMIVLPRQARDQHRENSQKDTSLNLQAAAVGSPNQDAVIITGGKQGGIGPQVRNRSIFSSAHLATSS